VKSERLGVGLGIALLVGCNGLHLTAIKAAQQRPSNVAVYFRLSDHGGNPIPDLTANSFRIYEDDQLVSEFESKQTIANPEVAAVHYTLLLVDMSGSVSGSGTVDSLVQAVNAFTDKLDKQKVALYAFDGGPDLYPIVPFGDQAAAKAGAAQLSTFKPKDPSTNLNGGVVKALDELDNALGKASQPLKFGTLVVFTDGTDRANRVKAADMEQHIREKPFDVFAIGLGAEIRDEQLARIGKSGVAMAADKSAIVKAFGDIGAKVEARTKSYYLLSYCSPSRAGKHEVRIQAVIKNDKDGSERVGNLRSDFDATGFAPGCDPATPPSFDVSRGDLLAPPPPDKPKKDEKDEKPEKRPARPARPAAPAAQAAPAPPAAAPPSPPPPAPTPKPAQDFNP
jgi:uncharacterized protein YegL